MAGLSAHGMVSFAALHESQDPKMIHQLLEHERDKRENGSTKLS